MPLKSYKSTTVPLPPIFLIWHLFVEEIGSIVLQNFPYSTLADCIPLVSFNMLFYPPFKLAYPQAWADSASIILAVIFNRWWCIRYIFGSIGGLNSELLLPTDLCWVLTYYRSFPIVKTDFFFPIIYGSTIIY